MKTITQKAQELMKAYPSYIRILDLNASCTIDHLEPLAVFSEMVRLAKLEDENHD